MKCFCNTFVLALSIIVSISAGKYDLQSKLWSNKYYSICETFCPIATAVLQGGMIPPCVPPSEDRNCRTGMRNCIKMPPAYLIYAGVCALETICCPCRVMASTAKDELGNCNQCIVVSVQPAGTDDSAS